METRVCLCGKLNANSVWEKQEQRKEEDLVYCLSGDCRIWENKQTLSLSVSLSLSLSLFLSLSLSLSSLQLVAGCLTSQQHAWVSQGRICSDNFTRCETEIEVADQTFYLIQTNYTDTGPTSSSVDPVIESAWQGSHYSTNFLLTGMTRPGKIPTAQAGIEPRFFRSCGGRF